MYESEGNSSIDSIEVGPSSPRALVTPRLPAFLRETPLSTKREKLNMTPKVRRPAPKVVKTAPPVRSFYSVMRDPLPRLVSPDGSTQPIHSPIYDHSKNQSFFEQCFQVNEIIGKGSFGEVFAARSLEDSRTYAVKVSIGLIRHNCANKYREVENHMRLPPHYNLVQFVRAWEEAGRLYIQTELCEMSLLHYCNQKHVLPEPELWNIFIDLLHAVDHLHSNDMIHDDIKPENIFLTKDMVCKLGDFGLVINLKNPEDVKSAEEGDSKYLAPEVLNSRPTKASDVFSLGMTILEAATDLDMPSNGDSWHQIRNGEIPDRFFDAISTDLKNLIALMLHSDPNLRPTTKELLEYPAIKRRLAARHIYVSWIRLVSQLRDTSTNVMFVMLTWCIAFLSVVFQHPLAMFQAVAARRNAICAKISNAPPPPPQQQQHTPIQTPEASKVFSESLAPTSAIASAHPFDYSDDENSTHYQRRLFPVPQPVSRFSVDDDDDEEQATSSSNSSAIDSTSSPVRPATRGNTWISARQGTPKSARKILLPPFGMRPTTAAPPAYHHHHGGSGDSFNQEDRAAWMHAKYQRMMQMEARLDSDDNETDIIDEGPHHMPPPQPPMSCPPMMLMRNGRRVLKAPKLDFSLLDDEDKPLKVPRTAVAKKRPAVPLRLTRSRMMSVNGSSGDEI